LGIKISPQDVRYNLKFSKTLKREHYPLKREEIIDIITPVPYSKKALYLALVSSGMRIGEALRIRRKDIEFSELRPNRA
jgi:integrase